MELLRRVQSPNKAGDEGDRSPGPSSCREQEWNIERLEKGNRSRHEAKVTLTKMGLSRDVGNRQVMKSRAKARVSNRTAVDRREHRHPTYQDRGRIQAYCE